MRLRKERNILNNNNFLISSYKAQPMHHNKNASMDIPQNSKSKNLYLNKILQKNMDPQKANIAQTNIRENIPNFQSSVQSILGNEESRLKAKNFVLNMRSKRNNLSPYSIQNEYTKDRSTFSNTYYDKFYNPIQKSTYELPQDNVYRNSNSRKEIIFKPNDIQYSLNYDYGSSVNNVIKVNKTNKYYDDNSNTNLNQKQNSSRGPLYFYKNNLKNEPSMNRNSSRGVFNVNNNNVSNANNFSNNNSNSNSTTILRNANTNYPLNLNRHVHFQKSQYSDNNFDNLNIKNNSTYYLNNNNYNDSNLNNLYIDENEFKENLNNIEINFENHLDSNSIIEKIENNNSSTGLKEIIIDNINELYHNPDINTHQFDLNEDDANRYTNRKTYELNSNNNNNNNNNISLYKPKNESSNNANIYKKYISDNINYKIGNNNSIKNKPIQKYYTKVNINPINRKNDKYIKYNLDNRYSNLKIEKNRIKIIAENKKGIDYNRDILQKIKNRFIQNIKAVKLNEINIKGENNNKAIKPNYESDNNININELNQIKNELEISKNKNIENEKLLNNYKNILNNQKKELDSKIKEISKIKNEQNANEQKMKNELNDAIKRYEDL